MSRVSFDILNYEVEKLYNQSVLDKDVNKHIEFIHDFVESCGWEWENYLYEWSGLRKLN